MRPPAYRKGTALSIAGVLEHAFQMAQASKQWAESDLTIAAKYQIMAGSAIELIEVHLDGNSGISCYKNLCWVNADGGNHNGSDLMGRIWNIVYYCRRHKLVPKGWHPNPEAI